MSRDQEEQDAMVLGALLRGEALNNSSSETASSAVIDAQKANISASDNYWLQETAADLMSAVDSNTHQSTFPLLREVEAGVRRGRLGMRGWATAVAVAAGVLLAVSWNMKHEGPSLRFVIEGSSGQPSDALEVGRVRAPQEERRTLKFSDGSELTLAKGGSVRVRETDAFGAEVVIENGTLDSQVTHREKTSWSVFAGPYEVEVTGTKFSTNWNPNSQRLVVLLDEGSVRVIGSDIEDHVALKPGQRFEAAPNEAWKVTAQTPQTTQTSVTPTGPNDYKDEPSNAAIDETPPPKQQMEAVANASNWRHLLRDGKFDQIMTEAQAQGLAHCYSGCSIERLRTLADAARYSGNVSVAREALIRLRGRSPNEAPRAGYLLGSLAEARGQAAGALTWYQGYLSEAPRGAFSAEARAGKMRALHALGRHEGAKTAASEYLRMHPSGASAATARRILNKK